MRVITIRHTDSMFDEPPTVLVVNDDALQATLDSLGAAQHKDSNYDIMVCTVDTLEDALALLEADATECGVRW